MAANAATSSHRKATRRPLLVWLGAARDGLLLRGVSLESKAYGLWSAACCLLMLAQFYASMKYQLFFAEARAGVIHGEQIWSAPLDDVFIHFDFARSAARGFPFQWSEGNGYSSGGTSLLYPLVLGFGHWLGYQGGNLMLWSGIVACVSIWLLLLWSKRLTQGLPSWTSFVLPPALLCVGALNWSFASGMEVAFFVGVWGLCLSAWFPVMAQRSSPTGFYRRAAALGIANLLLVATRPEAAVLVACFSLTAAIATLFERQLTGRQRYLAATGLLTLSAVPGAILIVLQGWANQHFTGNFSAAGALVKLEMHHPYMNAQQVIDAWWFHLEYQILRVTNYHFSDLMLDFGGLPISIGWLVWLLALVPLLHSRTRGAALLLWLSIASWLMVTALNGQVRWQNERYTMPAVAWLLLNAGTGLAVLLAAFPAAPLAQAVRERTRPARLGAVVGRGLLAAGGIGAALLFIDHQLPRFRDQLWFFGRASRNIYEQHIQVAQRLANRKHRPKRVLLGDAGAIPYVSDLPALDIIGLGGYRKYPFAQATRQGIGAALELIQRLPNRDRPDLMALYPSWWGDLPVWFGRKLFEAPVRGNVICGGYSKVVYRADWTPLLNGNELPPSHPALAGGWQVAAEVDFADLLSESAAQLQLHDSQGHISMKILTDSAARSSKAHGEPHDLWDAGRILGPGARVSFRLPIKARTTAPSRLLLLLAPIEPATITLSAQGRAIAEQRIEPSDKWVWQPFQLPAGALVEEETLELKVTDADTALYHLWLLQPSQ